MTPVMLSKYPLKSLTKAFLAVMFFLSGCASAPTKPEIHYASENSITLKYHAYDYGPTVTAEAIDIAIKHCNKFNKGMKLVSSNAVSAWTTAELHTFMCTNDFVDTRIDLNLE